MDSAALGGLDQEAMDPDAYKQIPMWRHREEVRHAKISHFVAGLILGAVAYYFWLQW